MSIVDRMSTYVLKIFQKICSRLTHFSNQSELQRKSIVFLNGIFLLEEHASISILDRGMLFGEGVFTTLRVFQGCIENLAMHLDQFQKDADALFLSPPSIKKEWLNGLIEKNHAFQGIWRLKIIYTAGSMEHSLSLTKPREGNLIMLLQPYLERKKESLKLALYPHSFESPTSKMKTLSYLDRLMIKEDGLKKQCDDSIVQSDKGFLLETSTSNIFWCMGNTLFTPDQNLPLLFGTTIRALQEVLSSLGMGMHYVHMSLKEIDPEVNFFTCNSMIGIRSVSSIEDRHFKVDFMLEQKLKQAYLTYSQENGLNP